MAQGFSEQVISHVGNVFGDGHVTLKNNTTGVETEIAEFETPTDFSRVTVSGASHATRFVPRAVHSVTGSAGDDTVVSLPGNIQPIAGEEEIEDQPYAVVVAYNTDTDTQYDIESVDYSSNEVTLGTDPADGETVKVWYVLTEGTLRVRGVDNVGQTQGSIPALGIPVHNFADVDQHRAGTEIHLQGRIEATPSDKIALTLDSDRQIVWEDADFPEGQYVSRFEQEVNTY